MLSVPVHDASALHLTALARRCGADCCQQVHKSVYKIHSLHCAYDRCSILGSVKFQAAKGEDPLVQYIK